MADWQQAFLSKVVLDQDTKAAVNAGITPEFFRDEDYRRIYEYILQHYNTYNTPADEQVMRQKFPTEDWEPQAQPLEYLIERLRQDRKFVLVSQGLNTAANFLANEDGDAMIEALMAKIIQARLETSQSMDVDITASKEAILDLLYDRMDNPGHLRGISTGVQGIDYVTGGLQPEQFVVIFGTPKSFKSANLLYMALAVHRQAKVPMFVGFEMSHIEQQDRLLSLISGVSLTKIMNGTLNIKELRQVEKALDVLEGMRPFMFSTDIQAASTVGGIQAKVQEYNPDVVFIDGAYLMQSEKTGVEQGSPQALTDISRSCKRLAQAAKVPIVITTQASLARSKGGLGLHSGMYTQAWGQDCDILLGAERIREEGQDEQAPARVRFRVLESRSGPRKDCVLEWDWSSGSVEEIDEAEVRRQLSGTQRYGEPDDEIDAA